ncbi:MAG: hypothetical protein ABFE07_29125 [Armatimonadia bacterium]
MELREYALRRTRGLEKVAVPVVPLLAGAARTAWPVVRTLGTRIFGAAKGLLSKVPKGAGSALNTAGNVSMVGSALKPAERPRMEV